jgi:hypothetical protein
MDTTSVMFIENTPFGELTRRLQECEDRLGTITGRRVRMVEMAGSQLSQLLPNTNPWAGGQCGRNNCHTCTQGGNSKQKEDCFRRNILYESRCGTCEDKEEGEKRKKRLKFGEKLPERHIYVDETARSISERCQEHLRDGANMSEDSHIDKHWEECHHGETMPEFRFRICKKFQDSLSRQVAESVRIDQRVEVLNSKTMYSRNRLPRLMVEKEEWEIREEEKRKNEKENGEKGGNRKRQRREQEYEKETEPENEHSTEEEKIEQN